MLTATPNHTHEANNIKRNYLNFFQGNHHRGKHLSALLFLAPALCLFAVFAWFPIIKAFYMSFHDVTLAGEYTWKGFDNYSLMLRDPAFKVAWSNSLHFALLSIIAFFLPVITAIFAREMRHAQGFFRIVYFLPTVVPPAIAIIIWRFIYDPDAGILNAMVVALGGSRQNWLNDVMLVKPSIILMMTWGAFGATTLIYLATLQEIPTELYEAAELDGATPPQRIRWITFPYLMPVISAMFILQVISVVQVFTEPFLLTKGGPGRATLTPTLHIYNRSFIQVDLDYAATWSVTMVIVLLVFSLFYRYVNSRLEG
jgi:multiple sugar transport system permease protein